MKAHISKGHLSKKNENGQKSPIGPFLGANLPLSGQGIPLVVKGGPYGP